MKKVTACCSKVKRLWQVARDKFVQRKPDPNYPVSR